MTTVLQLLLGIALVVAAFGLRDWGHSKLYVARTDRRAFEASLEREDDDADCPPTVH